MKAGLDLAAGLALSVLAAPAPALSGQMDDNGGGSTQSCKGLQTTLVGMRHTGPGDITAQYVFRNTNNDDMAMFVYYGGANGKNTFLIDSTGAEWPKKRVDGNGNHRQPLMAGVDTRYQLVFHVPTGGNDVRSATLVTWAQLLPLTGMGEVGWCKFQFANAPVG